jgi:hypothetical protein
MTLPDNPLEGDRSAPVGEIRIALLRLVELLAEKVARQLVKDTSAGQETDRPILRDTNSFRIRK